MIIITELVCFRCRTFKHYLWAKEFGESILSLALINQTAVFGVSHFHVTGLNAVNGSQSAVFSKHGEFVFGIAAQSGLCC